MGVLGNTKFNKASLARKSPGSIRCVAITTRRRYQKSLLSHHETSPRPHYKRLSSYSRSSGPVKLHNSGSKANPDCCSQGETRLENHLLTSATQSPGQCEGRTVTRTRISTAENNEAIVASTRSRLERSGHAPKDFELAESFGGGSECFSFWRPPVWPLNLIREQEDE